MTSAEPQAGFSDRLSSAIEKSGPLCAGLDPSSALLRSWALPDSLEGLEVFCDIFMEALFTRISIIKPQSAYFERFGPDGLRVMQRVTAAAQDLGIVAIIDAKRGDIDSTAAAYGSAFFGEKSPFRADAITAHPYLGISALSGLFDHALSARAGVFVVVKSSNPEGQFLQDARTTSGKSVAEVLAHEIREVNATSKGTDAGDIGAVLGATADFDDVILEALGHAPILVPGIGHQGGDIATARSAFDRAEGPVVFAVSRAILERGPDVTDLARVSSGLQNQLRGG